MENKLKTLILTNPEQINENRSCIKSHNRTENIKPPAQKPTTRDIVLFESRSNNQAFISTWVIFTNKSDYNRLALAHQYLKSNKKAKSLLMSDDISSRVIQSNIALENVESIKDIIHDDLVSAGVQVLSSRGTQLKHPK